jgi:hypothetical protein
MYSTITVNYVPLPSYFAPKNFSFRHKVSNKNTKMGILPNVKG